MAIYPTSEQIATSARVRAIGGDRTAGLESPWLLATTTRALPEREAHRG